MDSLFQNKYFLSGCLNSPLFKQSTILSMIRFTEENQILSLHVEHTGDV